VQLKGVLCLATAAYLTVVSRCRISHMNFIQKWINNRSYPA